MPSHTPVLIPRYTIKSILYFCLCVDCAKNTQTCSSNFTIYLPSALVICSNRMTFVGNLNNFI